jgi:PAS domain S-box-containing protein
MSSPLKLLLIDDNPDDRALVMRELRREFPDVRIEQARDAHSLGQALEGGVFDLVITDYQLKWTNGSAVLRDVKARYPDCPVIMFTGTGSEEIAVEAMKDGLSDYVLKSPKHVVRLSAAVKAALKRTENEVARKQAEGALARSERRLRTILSMEPECVKLLAADSTVLDMNPAGLAMIEADSLQQVQGKPVCELVVPGHRDAFMDLTRRVWRGESGVLEFEIVGLRGGRRWLETHAVPLRGERGEIQGALGITRDITARKQAEAQRDDLARRLFSVQESERRRIARDMHDEIGQALLALKFSLSRCQRTSDEPARMTLLSECLHITEDVLRQTRELALELRPSVLDDLGLGPAVEWHVERSTVGTGVKADCSIEAGLPAIAPDVQIACFRILQEAVTNSLRHARATRLTVTLRATSAGLELTITDDGVGFDVNAALRDASLGRSMGLLSMRERAELLGGKFCISSTQGRGTAIRVTFPLKDSSALPRSTGETTS